MLTKAEPLILFTTGKRDKKRVRPNGLSHWFRFAAADEAAVPATMWRSFGAFHDL